MTRLQAFADSLVHDIIDAGDCHCGTSYVEMKAVAERRIREFCNELTGVTDGVACDWYLDEKAT